MTGSMEHRAGLALKAGRLTGRVVPAGRDDGSDKEAAGRVVLTGRRDTPGGYAGQRRWAGARTGFVRDKGF
jgi:hypothetical protein